MLAAFRGYSGGVQVELVGIECYGLGSFVDVEIDVDFTLVCPWVARLKVEEGDCIVGRLDTAIVSILYNSWKVNLTHRRGCPDLKPS